MLCGINNTYTTCFGLLITPLCMSLVLLVLRAEKDQEKKILFFSAWILNVQNPTRWADFTFSDLWRLSSRRQELVFASELSSPLMRKIFKYFTQRTLQEVFQHGSLWNDSELFFCFVFLLLSLKYYFGFRIIWPDVLNACLMPNASALSCVWAGLL